MVYFFQGRNVESLFLNTTSIENCAFWSLLDNFNYRYFLICRSDIPVEGSAPDLAEYDWGVAWHLEVVVTAAVSRIGPALQKKKK